MITRIDSLPTKSLHICFLSAPRTSFSLRRGSRQLRPPSLCSLPARKNQGSQSPMPHIRLRFSSASAVSVHRSRHAFGVTLPLPDCPEATWTGRSPAFGLLKACGSLSHAPLKPPHIPEVQKHPLLHPRTLHITHKLPLVCSIQRRNSLQL